MEFGVWRGGVALYAKAVLNVIGEGARRRVHLFDVMGPMGDYGAKGRQDFFAVTETQLVHNFKKYGLLDDRVLLHKGLFEKSTAGWAEKHPETTIAVLRIDGNFYRSYECIMYEFYEMVPVGGFVIWDDLGHEGPFQFWTHFKHDNGIAENFTRIDNHAGWFRKTKAVRLNHKKRRFPRIQRASTTVTVSV